MYQKYLKNPKKIPKRNREINFLEKFHFKKPVHPISESRGLVCALQSRTDK